jgi:hypothetical protein
MPEVPNRARNPIQKVQGYIELGGVPVMTTEHEPRLINTQELLPDKHVRLVYPGTEIGAPMFDRDGIRITDQFVTADDKAFYSFYAETGKYDIRFTKPNTFPIEEIFRLTDVKIESRIYNVRDFGAKGDGVADDTVAIRKALQTMIDAYSSINGVGKLFFPNGRYLVTKQADLLPYILDLPSGIVIEGTAGPVTGGDVSNCQIVLGSADCSIFRIRTNRSKIIIRDIGLTTIGGAGTGTIAIDAREDVIHQNTYNIEFNNLTIWGFDRGLSVEGSHLIDPTTNEFEQWDITGVRVSHCTIVDCNYGIYLNSQNCDFMKIVDSRIGVLVGGFGIYMERVGIISIDGILGAGTMDTTSDQRSDTFIYLTAGHGTVTISGCECEGFNFSMQVTSLAVGNFAWPILLLNSTFGDTLMLKSQCDFVSIGNRYLLDTVHCDPNASATIYSFGDAIIGLDKVPVPAADFHLNNSLSRLSSRANHYRVDFQLPARFGGKAGLIAPNDPQMPIPISIAAFSRDDVQMALSDEEGMPLFNLHADSDYLYFEDGSTGDKLMRMDRRGNLAIHGRLSEEGI